MCPFAEVNRSCRHQHPRSGQDANHAAPEHRTARSTAVNNSPSTPDTTRTTAPASLISIIADAGFPVGAASATSGTNGGNEHAAGSVVQTDQAVPAGANRTPVGGKLASAVQSPTRAHPAPKSLR